MCGISPLSPLSGYDTVYKGFSHCEAFFTIPVMQDKNYYAWWTIVDNKLFLYGVQSFCQVHGRDDSHLRRKVITKDNRERFVTDYDISLYLLDFDRMEKFLNVKLSKELLPSSERKKERYKNGVIHAVWFTGVLFLKRFPRDDEPFGSQEYHDEPFIRLEFDKGHLIKTDVATCM
jgi:hypothetical protein